MGKSQKLVDAAVHRGGCGGDDAGCRGGLIREAIGSCTTTTLREIRCFMQKLIRQHVDGDDGSDLKNLVVIDQ